MPISPENRYLLAFLGVGILASIIFLTGLGKPALQDYDEAIYAKVVRETVSGTDPLTLKQLGNPWFEKPPLYFWLAMISSKMFGLDEFSLRLPSSLFSIAGIILIMLLAWEITKDKFMSLVTGLMFLTMGALIVAGRQVRLDVPVTVAIMFSFYSFLCGLKNPKWLIGIGIGVAVGIMFKSIIGFYAFPAILIWSIIFKNFSWLKNKYFWLGGFAGLAIILPWHLYETVKFGSAFWQEYFIHHVLGRFGENVIGGGQAVSNWNYFKFSFLFEFPWFALFGLGLLALPTALLKTNGRKKEALALGCSAVFIFTVFAAAGTKLFYYTIPAIPFMALFLGLLATDSLARAKAVHITKYYFVIFLLLTAGFTNALYVGFNKQKQLAVNQSISEDERGVGRFLATKTDVEKIYAFEYDYWDTISFYSNKRSFELIKNGQNIPAGSYVVIEQQAFKKLNLPESILENIRTDYSGHVLRLVYLKP